jgi:hypothetical protein
MQCDSNQFREDNPRRKTLMIKTFFPIIFIVALIACERQNPLLKVEADVVANWIYKNSENAYADCSEIWSDTNTADLEHLSSCDAQAETLASNLKKGGFGNVIKDDVKLPSIWIAYRRVLRQKNMNKFDAKKAAESFKIELKSN